MTIRTVLTASTLIAVAGTFAFAHPTQVVAGPIASYTIDQNRSYISAYVPDQWVSEDGWVGLGGDGYGSVSWSRGWKLEDFKLSGSFSLETVLSEWEPTRSRLYLGEQAIVTDAPDYAGFALPHFFAKQNDEISSSSNPCFDFGFYFDPSTMMWSCSGWSTGGSQADEGTLKNGVLSIDGVATGNGWFTEFTQLPLGVEPDPDAPIDYGPVTGEFRYHLVAVEEAAAVPEPATVFLIVGGLGVMGGLVRRRKATTA